MKPRLTNIVNQQRHDKRRERMMEIASQLSFSGITNKDIQDRYGLHQTTAGDMMLELVSLGMAKCISVAQGRGGMVKHFFHPDITDALMQDYRLVHSFAATRKSRAKEPEAEPIEPPKELALMMGYTSFKPRVGKIYTMENMKWSRPLRKQEPRGIPSCMTMFEAA